MKDTFLKVIDSYIPEFDEHVRAYIRSRETKNRFASELAEMMTAFVEWKDDNCKYKRTLYLFKDYGYWMTLENLFLYWYTNIFKK